MVAGPFVQGMEYAAGVTAEVVGKPEKTFFLEAIRNLGVSPHNTVMIGDVRYKYCHYNNYFCCVRCNYVNVILICTNNRCHKYSPF